MLTAAPSCHTLQIQYQSIGQSNVKLVIVEYVVTVLIQLKEEKVLSVYWFLNPPPLFNDSHSLGT